MTILCLGDEELAADPGRLDRAWQSDEPFALVPGRTLRDDAWFSRAWSQVPATPSTFALLTSGSTGRPKLVVGNRERATALARVLHTAQELEPVEQAIVVLPLTYSYAFVNQWVWTRTFGRELVSTRGFARPDELLSALACAKNALICLVGTHVDLLLRTFGTRAFEGVTRVCFAGGRFPQERLDDVRRAFPRAAIFNNYGCTEAMPRLSLRRAEAHDDPSHIGWPLAGVELAVGADSALCFRSPFSALGWVDDEGWHAVEAETWVPTGDLAAREADGGFRLLGRTGDVFKRHGEKVSLAALMETVLGVWKGEATLYRETDGTGESGCVLALSPAPAPGDLRTILLALRQRHVRAQWPLRVESIEAMPRLGNGKIDRVTLAEAPGRTTHWFQHIGNPS